MDAFQARIKHDGEWWAAIVLPDQELVVFADNGTIASLNECGKIIPYKTWVDLTEEIIGDDDIRPIEI